MHVRLASPRRLHSRRSLAVAAMLLFLALLAAAPARAEALAYRWSLKGFVGRVAGLVLPNEGRGELRTQNNGTRRVTELEITSPKSSQGEYFLYGSEARADGSTAAAWSSYRWRGEEKSKRDKVRDQNVVDVAGGIQLLRERAPEGSLRLRIWSDGKIYPVVVQRIATEQITVPAGTFYADHYQIRGVRGGGERFWKGGLDLWLAKGEGRTPVRIQVERGFANVRLDLLPDGA